MKAAGIIKKNPKSKRFRHSAGFGKRMEFWIIGRMLMEGIDVYIPLVDDNGIDAIVRRSNGSFVEVQIKARSRDVGDGDCALFAALTHELRKNYYFVFYSERIDKMWIMTSDEFMEEAYVITSKDGKVSRSIWFNLKRKNKVSGGYIELCNPRYDKYLAKEFSRISGSTNTLL